MGGCGRSQRDKVPARRQRNPWSFHRWRRRISRSGSAVSSRTRLVPISGISPCRGAPKYLHPRQRDPTRRPPSPHPVTQGHEPITGTDAYLHNRPNAQPIWPRTYTGLRYVCAEGSRTSPLWPGRLDSSTG
uniref:Uncharacterized protein n=1 Tax=Xenopus tropicalis TaxID=8364 RepID=A0A1B8XWX2_XENTR